MGFPYRRLAQPYLWSKAHRTIARVKPAVIAITGTIGKTSTKEAVAAVLAAAGDSVIKTHGNLNTPVGVALSILGYTAVPTTLMGWVGLMPKIAVGRGAAAKRYVLEYGADRPGDIDWLARQLPLDIAVITRITPAHMQAYANFEELIKEKFSIAKGLGDQGLLVLNGDDPVLVEHGAQFPRVLWYGLKERPTKKVGVWAHGLELTSKGWKFQLQYAAAKRMDGIGTEQSSSQVIQSQLFGRHQLYSLVAAAAVGLQQQIPLKKICKALEEYQLPAGRGRRIAGRKEVTILDDTYNSSPEAVKQGMDMVAEVTGRRRVAILGNMNELGAIAEKAHKEVAAYAASRVDFLVVVGEFASQMVEAAIQAGKASHEVIGFRTPEQLFHKLDQVVKKGDLVYIKGSQNGVRLERAVERLMAHPEQAAELLVRQSAYWKRLR